MASYVIFKHQVSALKMKYSVVACQTSTTLYEHLIQCIFWLNIESQQVTTDSTVDIPDLDFILGKHLGQYTPSMNHVKFKSGISTVESVVVCWDSMLSWIPARRCSLTLDLNLSDESAMRITFCKYLTHFNQFKIKVLSFRCC